MSLTHTPAPKHLRLKSNGVATTLPPGALALVDSLVGTFIGNTRSEVTRYMVISWLTEHIAFVRDISE